MGTRWNPICTPLKLMPLLTQEMANLIYALSAIPGARMVIALISPQTFQGDEGLLKSHFSPWFSNPGLCCGRQVVFKYIRQVRHGQIILTPNRMLILWIRPRCLPLLAFSFRMNECFVPPQNSSPQLSNVGFDKAKSDHMEMCNLCFCIKIIDLQVRQFFPWFDIWG